MSQHDFDVLVVGSGFGGSVTALRLTEKGYRVGVLEAGARFDDADFASGTLDLKKYLWAPASAGARWSTPTRSTARTRRSTTTRSGATSRTGAPSSPRRTTWRAGCSA